MTSGAPYFALGTPFDNRKTTTNIKFALEDNLDIIDIAMILFFEGGDFSLENDVLHIVEEDEEEQEQLDTRYDCTKFTSTFMARGSATVFHPNNSYSGGKSTYPKCPK